MMNTWFNNVNIFMEATGGVRELMRDLYTVSNGSSWTGSVEKDLWVFVEAADEYLRHNSGHLFTKVTEGKWEGFYAFLATVEWAIQHERTNITKENLLYLGIGW